MFTFYALPTSSTAEIYDIRVVSYNPKFGGHFNTLLNAFYGTLRCPPRPKWLGGHLITLHRPF